MMGQASDRARVEVLFEANAAGDVRWAVRSARLEEHLNAPYELTLELVSDRLDAEPVQLLGKPVKLTLRRGDYERFVTGIVAEVSEGAELLDRLTVRLFVRPALEALRHRVATRIFQDKSVPAILEEVLEGGLSPYERAVESRLTRAYPSCEYRVQYDESDLDFCRRLMEEEGIQCFFETEGDAETLVLADEDTAYGTVESIHGSPLSLSLRAEDHSLEREYLAALDPRSAIRPTKLATRHFDWTHPSTPIVGESTDGPSGEAPSGAHVDPTREVYEHDRAPLTLSAYDGSAYGANDADDQLRVRREAQVFDARVVEGRSTVTSMRTGATFECVGHPAPELDRGYVVLSVTHVFQGDAVFDGTTGAAGGTYDNTFRCIPDDAAFRPPRATPRPTIRSAQTALVVGPAGEEIHTDNHGRIRVQFHWDRDGAMDDHSTCWIRVMQPWAGAGWGFSFIPRIGMEVIVEFVEGDPDRPIVIGSLYGGERPPPYALPDDKTKSTIRTRSSPGGGGDNELRFEDLAGSEEVYVHAQKDFNEVVENDHTTTVHHDQMIRVDNDQTQEIGNDQTEHVFANQDLTVDANRTTAVHGDQTETVDGCETRTVSSSVTETIDAGETRTVTGGMTETITGGRSQTITGSSTESITGSLTQTIVGGITINTPATYEITAAGGLSFTTPGATTMIAPGGYTMLAPGGQTSIDESWASMGNTWFDSYATKASTVAVKIGLNNLLNILIATCHIDICGAKLTSGGAHEEFQGGKAETGGVKLSTIAGSIFFAGLFNKT